MLHKENACDILWSRDQAQEEVLHAAYTTCDAVNLMGSAISHNTAEGGHLLSGMKRDQKMQI